MRIAINNDSNYYYYHYYYYSMARISGSVTSRATSLLGASRLALFGNVSCPPDADAAREGFEFVARVATHGTIHVLDRETFRSHETIVDEWNHYQCDS